MEANELKRNLSLFDSTCIVIGSMIGSGIFIVSSDMARTIGCSGYLLLAWIVSGILTLCAALSYGELACMFPHAGGQYVYLKEAYGKPLAFLYGWTLYTVMHSGTIAAVSIAFSRFTGVLFPIISGSNWIYKIEILKDHIVGLNTENLLAISSIVFLSWINSRGLKEGKLIQNIFTSTKFLAVFFLVVFGLLIGRNSDVINLNFHNIWNASWTSFENGDLNIKNLFGISILGAFGVTMVGSIFSSGAWDSLAYAGGEVINPKKNIPLSFIIGVSSVIVLYVFVNITYLSILPILGNPHGASVFERGMQFAVNDRIGTAAVGAVLGSFGAKLMAILIMISTFGCNNGIILSTSRVYYAMAKDGLFFKRAGTLNKNHVPGHSLFMQCLWASLLCLSGTYRDLLDYVVSTWLLFYILTIFGIFILRKKQPHIERPYKVIGYPLTPIIYILLALFVSIDLLIYKPTYTWPGIIVVLIGIPIYYFWKKVKN